MVDTSQMAITIKAKDVLFGSTLRIDVRGAKRQRLRSRLGASAIGLGARIIGVETHITFSARKQHVRAALVEDGLPRKLSSGDRDFGRYGFLRVSLDGVPQMEATGYDADAGTVTRARTDADGKIMIDGDYILSETLEGRLEVSRITP